MKIFKIIIINILIFISFNTNAISTYKFENFYMNFIEKLEKKYSTEKINNILDDLNNKVHYIIDNKKLSKENMLILNMIIKINDNYIKNLQKIENKKIEVQEILDNQVKYEKDEINTLVNILGDIWVDKYAQKLESKDRPVFKINNKNVWVKEDDIYRISYEKWYIITASNYNYFKNKKGLIVVFQDNWPAHFVEKYKLEKKLKYSEIKDKIKTFVTKNKQFFLENNAYYSYKFNKTLLFKDDYWLFLSDLNLNWISLNRDLLFLNDWKFNFVKDYEKIRLISKNIISSVKNKELFLTELIDDKKKLSTNYDKDFERLKKLSFSITNNLSSDENKIKNIYNRVIQNTKYSSNINLNDSKIFSWIETYKNNDWVCEWYIKLVTYMLLFVGFEDIETIRWYVIDAEDFPSIWHAWLKINWYYYDPTFDDPIWAIKDRKFKEFKYFKLPKDLMYVNRFDSLDLPKEYKTMTKTEINTIIFNNLCKLINKYKDIDYKILKPCKFALKYWLTGAKIRYDDISKIFDIYNVEWNFRFKINWKTKQITKFKYFILDNENINNIIKTNFNYDLNWTYLFNWKTEDWNYEYRLAYDVELN